MPRPEDPKLGQHIKARLPGHAEPQACVVVRRYTVDGTYHLRGQDGQEYHGIPITDLVPEEEEEKT